MSHHFLFVSDLHGHPDKYEKLFGLIETEKPDCLLLGGDLLPSGISFASLSIDFSHKDFINDFLVPEFTRLKNQLGEHFPTIFLILGNDDGRFAESAILDASTHKIWQYINNRHIGFKDYDIFGYAYVPPTPFQLKDWEKYDVSRYTDPGCVSPQDGTHSVPVSRSELKYGTIKDDLEKLTGKKDLKRAIFLFHSPPYQTKLDRAPLDGKMIDYVPLDLHVGSIAIKRFIQEKQPLITLHGHVHESTRLTGSWRDKIGSTHLFNAAHDGLELSVIRFKPEKPELATRELI